jgi:hypothetical protein
MELVYPDLIIRAQPGAEKNRWEVSVVFTNPFTFSLTNVNVLLYGAYVQHGANRIESMEPLETRVEACGVLFV